VLFAQFDWLLMSQISLHYSPSDKNKMASRFVLVTDERIDNSHYRLIFDLGKKVYSWKEHTKMSKIAKFGCEML
jgi:hypothetical protein